MSRRIEDLDPLVQPKARAFLSAISIPYMVTSTLRTLEEQAAFYAQGRFPLPIVNQRRAVAGMRLITEAENRYEENQTRIARGLKPITVTNCDGVKYKSNHQGGRALDVVPMNDRGFPVWPPAEDPRWTILAAAGEAAGFSWGGRWALPDRPHYEIPEGETM